MAPVKIDDSNFKVALQLGFLNLALGNEGGKSASTVSFEWKLLEAYNFAQSKFNSITIELFQNKFPCFSNFSKTSSLTMHVVKSGESRGDAAMA